MKKLFVTILLLPVLCFGQEKMSASANVQLTNNGVSLFPNFSLGKPAVIVNANIGKKNFSFEPEFRWGLNGKPWSYIFWLRYRLKKEKFSFRTGLHPSYVFAEQNVVLNGIETTRTVSTNYGAAEVSPGYQFTDKFGVAIHYLHARGLNDYGTRQSNFISLQPRITDVNLTKSIYLNFFPQFFRLNLDDANGVYVNETTTINIKDFPLYISNVLTYKLKSTIPGDDFVWSVGLNVKL
ncbi:hypothetical protein [Jiulongibacter sp. NS-SX5]|uniref:hypothetical protein n=1 Tax=Jiulongibacter sp. NS-SX5 TaxID=3463854 RepID=UPI00405A0625